MKKCTVISFLMLFFFLMDVSDCKSQNNSEFTINVQEVEIIPVANSELSYSNIQIIQPVNGHFVIIHSQPEGVSVINRKGELQYQPGTSGRGPFEIQTPGFVHYENQKVFIWDSGNLKFLVFDANMEPDRELLGIRHAISGFKVNQNGLIAVFQSPRFQENFVHIYEVTNSNSVINRKDLGVLTDKGRALFFHYNTGGVAWNENELVWVEPSKTILNIYSLEKDEISEIPFEDPMFVSGASPFNADGNFTRQTMDQIVEYFQNNSRIVSVRKLEEHILVEMEHFRDEESILTYTLFDLTYNKIGRVELEEGGSKNYIRGVDGNKLFYRGDDYENTGVNHHIRVREITVEKK